MSRKRPLTPPSSNPSLSEPPPTQSAPLVDRSSTFIALYSPTISPRDLQAHPSLADASHRILAWRLPSKQTLLPGSGAKLCVTGSDEDGERFAGKKLEKLLGDMKAEGAVVVGRWFGGVMLGPVRFTHIEGVARESILKWRAGELRQADELGSSGKKRKVEESEEQQKERMVEVLGERDASIATLRGLLKEKSGEAKAKGEQSPAKVPNYASMPLQALIRLEKARDATIAWILKEITRVEEAAKTEQLDGS